MREVLTQQKISTSKGLVEVWTDGACSPNPGYGGWAWATKDGRKDSGSESEATNQRMEIMAVVKALTALDDGRGKANSIQVYTDSQFVISGATGWIFYWPKKGWKTKKRFPVKHKDLWVKMLVLVSTLNVRFTWVKGHSGDPMNELVDRLAGRAGREGSTDLRAVEANGWLDRRSE